MRLPVRDSEVELVDRNEPGRRAEGRRMMESERFFDSDPNLTASTRAGAPKRSFPIVMLALDADLRSLAE